MESKEELRKIDIKNPTGYYFDDIIFYWTKNHMKIF